MTNRNYWQKRMKALENQSYQSAVQCYQDIQEEYRKAINSLQMDIMRWYQRLADNNDISYAAAKKFLKTSDLEEFKWTVEQYIKAGEENAIDQRWMKQLENASCKYHISYLEAMKLQAQQHAELLLTELENGVTEHLHKTYSDQFYRSAYEIAKGTGVGSNLAALGTDKIELVLQKPWARDEKNFSDRIWSNKEKLINNLHTDLTQSIIRGEDPQKAINQLARDMNVSRSQAGNLIMTETAAISAAAQKDCFKELKDAAKNDPARLQRTGCGRVRGGGDAGWQYLRDLPGHGWKTFSNVRLQDWGDGTAVSSTLQGMHLSIF